MRVFLLLVADLSLSNQPNFYGETLIIIIQFNLIHFYILPR